MPSLQDLANQINNTLNQIETNTQDAASSAGLIKGDTADIKNGVNNLIAVSQNGFQVLANGLAAVIDQQKTGNHLLDHMRRQNDTIICWLTISADLLCRLLHRANTQIELQTAMEDSLRQLKETLELVHGTETVEVLHRRELQERMDECCPEDEPKPEHCYEPCRSPEFKPTDSHVDFDPNAAGGPRG